MILIVSYSDDPHVALVGKALEEGQFTAFACVDLEEAIAETKYVIGGGTWRILPNRSGGPITPENLSTVWWRRSGKFPTPKSTTALAEADRSECYWGLRWLVESLPDSLFPLGHPTRIRAAENKVRQLATAEAIGFQIPATCISNDKDTLRSFCTEHESVVVKPLYLTGVQDADGRELFLGAFPIEPDRLVGMLERHDAPPFLFCQERIRKQKDIRAVFLPDGRHFACEIDSGLLGAAEVDWRPRIKELRHTATALPEEIRIKGEEYLSRFRLTSGSFDFGVTNEGDWVFFECNPNGQWLWLELETGYELARQVAAILLKHHQHSPGSNRGSHV